MNFVFFFRLFRFTLSFLAIWTPGVWTLVEPLDPGP